MSGAPSADAVVVISGGHPPPSRPSPSSSAPLPLTSTPSPSHSTPKRRKLLAPRRRRGSGGDLRACWGGGGTSKGAMPATAAADVAISAPIAAAVGGHLHHHSSHHHLPHHSLRHHHITARALADITPRYAAGGSGGNADVELHRPVGGGSGVGSSGGSIRITHLVGGVSSVPGTGVGGGGAGGGHGVAAAGSGAPRFPKLDECAHFHYENVELGPIQVSLCEEELKPLNDTDGSGVGNENRSWVVQVTSLGRSWLLRRSYDNFRMLDSQLHRCVYDRKFSALPELPPEANVPTADPEQSAEEAVRSLLTGYLSRLTCLAGDGNASGGWGSAPMSASLINCGPVLNWLELDNRGHRLLVTDDSDINTPAVAAAYAVRRYAAQAPDEISFEVGDMISVIDMPPPEESVWWRGKKGFEVGFFPCECVALIGEKVPRSLLHQLVPAASQQHSLTATAPSLAGATCPSSPAGTVAPTVATPASSCASTASSSPSPASSGIVVASPSSQPGLPLPSKPVLRKHGKLIAFFRSFILSRPSRRRLKQSGILKERVFGCDLGEHLLNSGHEIPMVLKCCAEFIETNGIVDGIYRLSGVTSNIQKLRNAFDEDRVPGLYDDEAILQDIHSVASLLKMYFRELPNPLCTYHLYHRFVSAVQAPQDSRLSLMREVVKSLPPPHYRTLEYLMRHLARVAQRGGDTGMTPRNVAIVWAPNLLRCKELEVGGVAALQGVGVQAVVTEFLICYADLIFGGMDKGGNLMGQRLRQQRHLHQLSPDQHKLPPGVSPGLVAAFAAENATPKRSRPKSLAISTPTKLLSLEEARTRVLLAATGKADQEYIEVGGGPANLPAKYHTVIDMPARKRGSGSLKSKRSPGLGWKSFFSKKIPSQAQRQQSTSSLTSKRNILGGGVPAGTSTIISSTQVRGIVTPTELVTQDKALTESDLTQSKRRLRPVKSAESLSSAVASAGSSTRNSAALDLEIGLGSIEGVLDQIVGQSSGLGLSDDRRASSPSTSGKPSHSRSVSHDSYFDHLAEPLMLLTEEEDGRDDEAAEGDSGNLEEEGLLDLSEIQLDFELEEREMRIFSEDETLVSTTPLGSGGSLSRSPLLAHPTRRRLLGSPQGTGPRARPEDTGSSADPSPKKKKSGASAVSPGARKRSKVEDRVPAPKSPSSSTPSPASSPMRSIPYSTKPAPPSLPSMLRRSGYSNEEEEEEEEELRYIDSQSPEPPQHSASSMHRESSASYGSMPSSRGSWQSQNHYHQSYQQQQVLVHAEVHHSPSEDASSVSRADATVSDNESFTVHGGETSSEGDIPAEALSIADPLPEDEEEEEEEDGEGGVSYAPLVNDATAETTPVDPSTPAYENVSWARGVPPDNVAQQNTMNLVEKKKCPTASPRNLDSAPIGRVYQNIHSNFTENILENGDGVYEEVQINNKQTATDDLSTPEGRRMSGSSATNVSSESNCTVKLLENKVSNGKNEDPEEVYQQVKAFRKSVQEVNEMLGGVADPADLSKQQETKCVDGSRNACGIQNKKESPRHRQGAISPKDVREVGVQSDLPVMSNGSSEESSDSRVPSEELALLRTPSGRSGISLSGGSSRRSSLPVSPCPSSLEDSHRRRFDSEIGRDILRERRVKLELERVRGEPGSGVSSPASSEGTGTRLTPSPVATPVRTLSPASTQSPVPTHSPVRTLSPAPSHSPAHSQSSARTQSPSLRQSPIPTSQSPVLRQSPVPRSQSPPPRQSPVPPSQSPIPRQSPIPASQSPVSRQSPIPTSQSPISRQSPITVSQSPIPRQSPVSPLSPVSLQPSVRTPSPSYTPPPLVPVSSPTRTVQPFRGASCPRSPIRSVPADINGQNPSGVSSSHSSLGRTSSRKSSEGRNSEEEGSCTADTRVETPKTPSPKRDVTFKNREDGFGASFPSESNYRGWGSEGGSLRGLPGRSWSVSDSRRLAVRKASVRELLSRFESKEGAEGEEESGVELASGRRASAPSHRRPTPPCLRARANRASHASALSVSLDEETFLATAREKVWSSSQSSETSGSIESTPKGGEMESGGQLIRVRTSPDINKDAEGDDGQVHMMDRDSDARELSNNRSETNEEFTARVKMESSLGAMPTFPDTDDPERRERIERYKRERRSFLREKYRSESFRGERDEVLKRLKEKVASVPQEDQEGVSTESDCRSRRRTRRAATDGDCSEIDSQFSPTIGLLSTRARHRATSSESDEAGECFSGPRVSISPVLSRSPHQRHGVAPTSSSTSSIGTPSPGCIKDVAALFEAREKGEKFEKSD